MPPRTTSELQRRAYLRPTEKVVPGRASSTWCAHQSSRRTPTATAAVSPPPPPPPPPALSPPPPAAPSGAR
eukprot:7104484-Prymnesium_polylepis.1